MYPSALSVSLITRSVILSSPLMYFVSLEFSSGQLNLLCWSIHTIEWSEVTSHRPYIAHSLRYPSLNLSFVRACWHKRCRKWKFSAGYLRCIFVVIVTRVLSLWCCCEELILDDSTNKKPQTQSRRVCASMWIAKRACHRGAVDD